MRFAQSGHFADKGGGSSDADVRTFWCKHLGSFEINGVSAWIMGVEPVRTFCGQGGRVEGLPIFRNFVWTSFMDDP